MWAFTVLVDGGRGGGGGIQCAGRMLPDMGAVGEDGRATGFGGGTCKVLIPADESTNLAFFSSSPCGISNPTDLIPQPPPGRRPARALVRLDCWSILSAVVEGYTEAHQCGQGDRGTCQENRSTETDQITVMA